MVSASAAAKKKPAPVEFSARMEHFSHLLDAIQLASKFAGEAAAVATPEGITLRAMDESRCAMVELSIPKAAFSVEVSKKTGKPPENSWSSEDTEDRTFYECPSRVVMGLPLERFAAMLRRFGATSCGSLELTKEGGTLSLELSSRSSCDYERKRFDIRLLDIQPEELAVKQLSFQASFNVEGCGHADLNDAIADAKAVGADALTITAERKKGAPKEERENSRITFDSRGAFGNGRAAYEDRDVFAAEGGDRASATYSLPLLERVKSAKLVRLSTDAPMQTDHTFGYGDEGKKIRVKVWIAPRLDGPDGAEEGVAESAEAAASIGADAEEPKAKEAA